jgi:hypothetical protein
MDARTEREKRLAEALRQNLHRRKAQAREPAPVPPEPDDKR